MIWGIAEKTGWDEDKILDMPLSRVWQYRHALLRSFDMATYYIISKDEKQELYELFKTL